MCLISWERTQKGDTHKLFRGGNFGVKKGVPNGPFWATKSLVYCFFPALKSKVCKLGALQRQVDLQGMFEKTGNIC